MSYKRLVKILMFFVTSMTLNVMEVEADFSRRCQTATDCVFDSKSRSGRVFLDCQNDRCQCKNFELIADVPKWNLKWVDNTCFIDSGGPCGRDKGPIDIYCASGLDCIESNCRSRAQIGTHQLGQVCVDDLDCQQGLQCVVTSFSYQPTRTCVIPKSAAPHNQPVTVKMTMATTVQPTTVKNVQLNDQKNSTNVQTTRNPLEVGDEEEIKSNGAPCLTFSIFFQLVIILYSFIG